MGRRAELLPPNDLARSCPTDHFGDLPGPKPATEQFVESGTIPKREKFRLGLRKVSSQTCVGGLTPPIEERAGGGDMRCAEEGWQAVVKRRGSPEAIVEAPELLQVRGGHGAPVRGRLDRAHLPLT